MSEDLPLSICEVFRSLAGETSWAGLPATFLRLAGCNLRCRWCDTPQAREPGRDRSVAEVAGHLLGTPDRLVVVTGGEPLLQPGVLSLCRRLVDAGREVLLETNGSLDVSAVDRRVHVILDLKPPGSGQSAQMDLGNLERLKAGDELKLVLCDRADFDWARVALARQPLAPGVGILLSAVAGELSPRDLAGWILESGDGRLRLQIQLHKHLWPDSPEGVSLAGTPSLDEPRDP